MIRETILYNSVYEFVYYSRGFDNFDRRVLYSFISNIVSMCISLLHFWQCWNLQLDNEHITNSSPQVWQEFFHQVSK